MSDWRQQALRLRAERSELTNREIAAQCGVPLARVKGFLSKHKKDSQKQEAPSALGAQGLSVSGSCPGLQGPSTTGLPGSPFELAVSSPQDLKRLIPSCDSPSHGELAERCRELLGLELRIGPDVADLEREIAALLPQTSKTTGKSTSTESGVESAASPQNPALPNKLCSDYVRALAIQKRTAEAYVWIADGLAQGYIAVAFRRELFAIITRESPCMGELLEGVFIEKSDLGGYKVRTTVPIKAHQRISKERAVVPWGNGISQDDARIREFLETTKSSDIEKANGLFPRTFEEIPTAAVPSLSTLEATVRKHFSARTSTKSEDCGSKANISSCSGSDEVSEHQIQELIRAIAVAKLCSHDDGLHHFGSFYNHSCAPNCEVRGAHDLHVHATRDIAAGEELCISYLGEELDYPATVRRLFVEKGWGALCGCERCASEIEMAGEMERLEMEWRVFHDRCEHAVVELAQQRQSNTHGAGASTGMVDMLRQMTAATMGGEYSLEIVDHIEKKKLGWRDVWWKELHVLKLFCKALQQERVASTGLLAVGHDGHVQPNDELPLHLARRIWPRLEKCKAVDKMLQLLELKKRHTPSGSLKLETDLVMLDFVLQVMEIVGATSKANGLATPKAVRAKRKEIKHFLDMFGSREIDYSKMMTSQQQAEQKLMQQAEQKLKMLHMV